MAANISIILMAQYDQMSELSRNISEIHNVKAACCQ
jgi:hypothetical protein